MQQTIQRPTPAPQSEERDDRSDADSGVEERPADRISEGAHSETSIDRSREVTLTGPDGTDHRLEIPEGATEDEIVAITAAVSTMLTTQPIEQDDGVPEQRTSTINAWTFAGRCATTGRKSRSTRSIGCTDAWKLASRTQV